MHWLSESVDALFAEIDRGQAAGRFDAIVVGSGYGGAVAALRLAEAGLSVAVLERGREYLPGAFPNDLAHLPGHVRMHRAGAASVTGPEDALFDVRMGDGVSVLVGNALGGTSQINANVVEPPDPRVFDDPVWPASFHDGAATLSQHFATAIDMLGAAPFPTDAEAPLQRREQLERMRGPLQRRVAPTAPVRFVHPRIAVTASVPENVADTPVSLPTGQSQRRFVNRHGVEQGECVGCGDCVTGCNFRAKNTLTMNYLPRAKQAGARLFTGVSVLALRKEAGREGAVVTMRRTAVGADPSLALERSLHASVVVLAAGTLGTVEILQRSGEAGLALSERLGKRFSTNGDWIAVGMDQDAEVHPVGWGATREQPRRGPTITGMLDARGTDDVRHGLVYEDAGIPGALGHIFREVLATTSLLPQLERAAFKGDGHVDTHDPLGLRKESATHSQAYLGMGHDASAGDLRFVNGRTFPVWRDAAQDDVCERHMTALRAIEALGGVHLPNPLARPLPDLLAKTLSGSKPAGAALTVHPLGGCVMGASAAEAVVDEWGRLFDPTMQGAVHEGLYVMDGSVMPTSLGVNPLLTITAIAERNASELVRKRAASRATAQAVRHALPAVPATVAAFVRDEPARTAMVLQEVMRGEVRRSDSNERWPAMMRVAFRIPDVVGMLEDPRHRIEGTPQDGGIAGTVAIAALPQSPFAIEGGSIELLRRDESAGLRLRLLALFTWLQSRGIDELRVAFRNRGQGESSSSWKDKLKQVIGFVRLTKHAGEVRSMRYALSLRGEDGRRYTLEGNKAIRYSVPAPLGEAWRDLRRALVSRLWRNEPAQYFRRPNIWKAVSVLRLDVKDDEGRTIATGETTFDILHVPDHLPQISSPGIDSPTAFTHVASLGLFFLRNVLKLHLWNFVKPDYSAPLSREALIPGRIPMRPDPERAAERPYRLPDPEYFPFKVDRGAEMGGRIELLLTRYAQPAGAKSASRPDAVMLMPGFAQSTTPFLAETMQHPDGKPETNLVEYLHREGFDVWLFDFRTSTALECVGEPWTLDQVAAIDIPAAVDVILANTGHESIKVFAHCMSCAALSMSLLGGHLARGEPDAEGRRKSKIASAVLSQVTPHLVGGRYTQLRRELAALLRDAFQVYTIDLAAADTAGAMEAMLDRLLTSFPVEEAERCPHEGDYNTAHPDIATCRRVTGLIGRLFNHRNLSEDTHRILDRCFGKGSLEAFAHISRFFDYERVVTASGDDAYLTDANVRRYMDLPILLVHGADNVAFDPEGSLRTLQHLQRVNGGDQYFREVIPGYAHFDCITGNGASRNVFPKVAAFLHNQPRPETSVVATPPRYGPVIGAIERPRGGVPGGPVQVRIWMRIDDPFSLSETAGITALRLKSAVSGSGEALEDARAWAPLVSRRAGPSTAGERFVVAEVTFDPERHCGIWAATVQATSSRPGAVGSGHATRQFVHAASAGAAPGSSANIDPLTLDSAGRVLHAATVATPCTSIPVDADHARRWRDEMIATLARRTRAESDALNDPLSRQERRHAYAEWCDIAPAPAAVALAGSVDELTFALGSCIHPATGMEIQRAQAAITSLANAADAGDRTGIAFAVLAGDQVYVDATAGVFDTLQRLERIGRRYEDAWRRRGFRRLARRVPLVMAIDDHEIVDNWTLDRLAGGPAECALRDEALRQFRLHQWMPGVGVTAGSGTPLWHARTMGGFPFFVADTRTARSRRAQPRPHSVMNDAQWSALEGWLASAPAERPVFVVMGSVVAPFFTDGTPPGCTEGFDNWQEFPAELERLMRAVVRAGTHRHVVFLSGDYHCAAHARIVFERDGHEVPQLRAESIVGPALFSPYPFADTRAQELVEAAPLARFTEAGHSWVVRYSVVPASTHVGNGHGIVQVTADAHNGWRIGYTVIAAPTEEIS